MLTIESTNGQTIDYKIDYDNLNDTNSFFQIGELYEA